MQAKCCLMRLAYLLLHFRGRIESVSYPTTCYNIHSILSRDFEIYVSAHPTYSRQLCKFYQPIFMGNKRVRQF